MKRLEKKETTTPQTVEAYACICAYATCTCASDPQKASTTISVGPSSENGVAG